MTCEEFEELSGAYALEAVTPAEREAAQAHLAGCAACTHRLQELRAVVKRLVMVSRHDSRCLERPICNITIKYEPLIMSV
jgi:anti-sigma factor RsiW